MARSLCNPTPEIPGESNSTAVTLAARFAFYYIRTNVLVVQPLYGLFSNGNGNGGGYFYALDLERVAPARP